MTGAISSRRKGGGFLIMLVPSHHGPSHSGELVGERDGGNLGRKEESRFAHVAALTAPCDSVDPIRNRDRCTCYLNHNGGEF
jgi:hypothetical protein